MREVFLPRTATENDILNHLEKHGIAVLEQYVEPSKHDQLNREFFSILEEEERSSPRFVKKGDSRVARIGSGIDGTKYPLTADTFTSKFMDAVAREYFSPYAYNLNRQIYLTHDKNFMDFGSPWHTDPSRSLKFLLYLTDTTAENGAFMYAPGSHLEGFYRMMYYRRRGIDEFPNMLPDAEVLRPTMSVEAKAGSLVIFEAAGIHKAGNVKQGSERRVIRGHTYLKTTRLGRLFRRLLLRSPFNLARYDLCEDDFVNGRFKSRATPGEY